jgi:hypothetical protein
MGLGYKAQEIVLKLLRTMHFLKCKIIHDSCSKFVKNFCVFPFNLHALVQYIEF